MRDYTLVLKDTSPSEMDKFEEWMFQICNNILESKKNVAEMEKQITASQKTKTIPTAKKQVKRKSEVIKKPIITKLPVMPTHKGVTKIYQRGFIIATSGIRLHGTPTSNDANYKAKVGRYAKVYDFLRPVTVVHEELDNLGWYKIKTEDGQYGYIEKRYIEIVPIDKKLDDYTRTLLYVKPGYSFEKNVANYFYANYEHKTGDDRRTLAEAFYLLNMQSKHKHGVVLRDRNTSALDKLDVAAKAHLDPNFHNARALYDQLQLTSGRLVRIPTKEYIALQKKKGTVSQRSAVENFIIEMARAYQGFHEGFTYGLINQVKDLVVGLWDLLKGILTGSLFKNLWDFVVKIWEGGMKGLKTFLEGIIDALGRNWNTFWKKFNSGNPRLQAYLIGELIAVVVFNIALAILTAGATVYLAATTKGAALLAKLPRLAKLVNKSIDLMPKSQKGLIEKVLKEKAGNVIKDSRNRILAKQAATVAKNQTKKEALERLNRINKKNNSNPAQHSEFIDTDKNIPGSKKPPAKKPPVKKIDKKKTKKIISDISDNWSSFTPELDKKFEIILKKLRGNSDKSYNSKFRGREGQIFEIPSSTNLIIKRWHKKSLDLMSKSIYNLQKARKMIISNPKLKKLIDVVEVKEIGDDWIIRGFNKNSFELSKIVSDPLVTKIRKKAIDELSKFNDDISKSILKKINKNSANIHWDPITQKILIIDML